ncbi:MAG: F0F1 ATP synthase subunit gamma, partial [Patescibacteria group bacterium]
IQTICIGKRGADAMKRANQSILASFTEITNNTKFEEVLPIGRMVIHEFTNGDFDRVLIAYTDFISAITQKPIILELLPLGLDSQSIQENESSIASVSEYTFEPSPRAVLDRILPRLVETMLYQAVLESAASEHSSRMMAMRSASDAAGDMIGNLTFAYNQARQAGITQEIAEISSGKAALET